MTVPDYTGTASYLNAKDNGHVSACQAKKIMLVINK
jgi:hypothetical protein